MSKILKLLITLLVLQLLNALSVFKSDPPPPSETALTARYIVHSVDWASISTISTLNIIKAYPLGNIKSISDGPVAKGTGVPYLFVTPEDLTGMDLEVDNKCTFMATLAQTDYCTRKKFDPQDPRCARVIIAGHLLKVDNTTEEFKFAKSALFERHPRMAEWPTDHYFYVVKLNVETIMVLDYTGRGIEYVKPEDYFNANGVTNYKDELQKI